MSSVGSIGRDTDALAFRADGTLFGKDVTLSAAPARSLLYSVNSASGNPTNLGNTFPTAYNLNDMTFGVDDGVLYGIMNDVGGSGSYLATIGIGSGTPSITTLGRVSIDNLGVLAARPSYVAPEPATWLLLVSGLFGLASYRSRMKKRVKLIL